MFHSVMSRISNYNIFKKVLTAAAVNISDYSTVLANPNLGESVVNIILAIAVIVLFIILAACLCASTQPNYNIARHSS